MKKPPSRNILLVCKARHAQALALGEEIGAWLRQQGHRASVITAEKDSPAYAQEDLSFVTVLGGDGTMLGVARRLVGRKVPVLGINFGRVGFLTDAQPEQWQDKLVECLHGDEPVRACMALTWSVTRQGKDLAHGHGVNVEPRLPGPTGEHGNCRQRRAHGGPAQRRRNHLYAHRQLRLQRIRGGAFALSLHGRSGSCAYLPFFEYHCPDGV